MDERRRSIGEVARATGLTVRALHHYEEIGLLASSERSAAGYRRYTPADLRRLFRVVALRRLGFRLHEVAGLLDGDGVDPADVVRTQLRTLEARMAEQERLRMRLIHILDALERTPQPSTDLFIDAIEVMTHMERYYTPEQLGQLEERRRALGEDGMERAQRDWAGLIAEVDAERARGTDPASARGRELAERWQAMVEAFTGGDPGIRRSLQTLYETEGPATASRGLVDPAAMEWMGRACRASG